MKSLIFDTGPIISLTMNNLMWILVPLKKKFGGEFYCAESVKNELVDKPLTTKKFKFEALHTLRYMKDKTLIVDSSEETKDLAIRLLSIANSIFSAHSNNIQIVHYADMETLALAMKKKAESIVTDERTLRVLIERPQRLHSLLENKLHMKVNLDKEKLNEFKQEVGKINVIRSIELVTIAYEMGLLDPYLPDMKESHETLLSALLWGVKCNGCAVSVDEIDRIIYLESKMKK